MVAKTDRFPDALKELVIAEFMSTYFARHSRFPANDEIASHLVDTLGQYEVGPLHPKNITSLKKGAFKLLTVDVSVPRNTRLELELRSVLDLDGAVVVGKDTATYDAYTLRKLIGYHAARFFDENVREGQEITLSCSITVGEMISALRRRYCDLTVYADCVLAVDAFHIINPVSITVLFLDKFPGCCAQSYILPRAAVDTHSREGIQKMLDSALFEKAFNAHWFFAGIGVLGPKPAGHGIIPGFDFLTRIITRDADALKKRGVVGEISYWPFDYNGQPVFKGPDEHLEYFKYVYTYSNFQILERQNRISTQHKTRVVGAAGGLHKVKAIKAAARYLDYLITDVATARAIVEGQ